MTLHHPAVTDSLDFLRSIRRGYILAIKYQVAIGDYTNAAHGCGSVPSIRRSDCDKRRLVEDAVAGRLSALSKLLEQTIAVTITDSKLALRIIMSMSDTYCRDLLLFRYIRGHSMRVVAYKLGSDRTYAVRQHHKAVEFFGDTANKIILNQINDG